MDNEKMQGRRRALIVGGVGFLSIIFDLNRKNDLRGSAAEPEIDPYRGLTAYSLLLENKIIVSRRLLSPNEIAKPENYKLVISFYEMPWDGMYNPDGLDRKEIVFKKPPRLTLVDSKGNEEFHYVEGSRFTISEYVPDPENNIKLQVPDINWGEPKSHLRVNKLNGRQIIAINVFLPRLQGTRPEEDTLLDNLA